MVTQKYIKLFSFQFSTSFSCPNHLIMPETELINLNTESRTLCSFYDIDFNGFVLLIEMKMKNELFILKKWFENYIFINCKRLLHVGRFLK